MYNNDPRRAATGEVRLSYVHLNEARSNPKKPNAKPKFSATLLIPKTDTETKRQIDETIAAAYEYGVKNKWQGNRPTMISKLIHDGDGTRQDGKPYGAECKGHWVLTASSVRKPGVCDITNPSVPLLPDAIYSGMYARVTLSFYNPDQGNPVACSLDNVFKTRDGEPLSGGATIADDFAALGVTAPAAPQINPLTGQPIE